MNQIGFCFNPKITLIQTFVYFRSYPNAKYVGIHKFTTPSLLIRDLDVVNEVLVKKCSDFGQNEFFVNEKIDPLLVQSPFIQTGDSWRKTRSMLTPIFTPSRVKQLFPLVQESTGKLIDHLEANVNSDFEAKTVRIIFQFSVPDPL